MTLDSGAWVIIAASPIFAQTRRSDTQAKHPMQRTKTKKEGQEEPPFLKVRPI